MQRRRLVVAMVALSAAPSAFAQRAARVPRVGVMLMQSPDHPFPRAFRAGLRELGYVEGRTIDLELRSAEGDVTRLAALASEFVKTNVDVIVAGGGTVGPRAAMRATATIPIVFPVAADPVATRLVKSLARPGGNVTGLALFEEEMSAKRLQLVRELLPGVRRVAIIADPSMGAHAANVKASSEAADALGLQAQMLSAKNPTEAEAAFAAAKGGAAEAVVVLASSALSRESERLVRSALRHRLITVWENRVYTEVGGLVSYGHDIADMYRGAARYVDRILKGAKPADLPVEQGTKLDLVVNLKVARDFGITIPPALLVRADHIITE